VYDSRRTWVFFTSYGAYEWLGEPPVRSAVIALTHLTEGLDWHAENSDALPPDDGTRHLTAHVPVFG
jgi:hypothetical protein